MAAVATQTQKKPWWLTVEFKEEDDSDFELFISRSPLVGIEDDGFSKVPILAAATQPQKKKPWWAMVEMKEEDGKDLESPLSRSRLVGTEDGKVISCRKAIEDRFDDGGSMAKMTSTTRVGKLARTRLRAIERRSWSKFGEAIEDDASSQVTTTSSEEIPLERPRIPVAGSKVDELAAFGDPLAMLASKGDAVLMVCRTCGEKGDHWTFRCPFNNIEAKTKRCPPSNDPPICEVCMDPLIDVMRCRKEECHDTICVTNLSKDICESDLINLLYRFGLIVHISLAVDEDSDSSRQFGIVQYSQGEEAVDAMSSLDGYKYRGLILGVEWARKGADAPPLCPSCMQATENCVLVTNVSEDTCVSDLYDLFCSCGSANRARLVVDKARPHRQVGIVEFVKREDAERSIEFLNGFKYYCCSLIVEGPFRSEDVERNTSITSKYLFF